MFLDRQNLCSDDQSLAQVVGSYLSTHSIDLLATGTDNLGNTPISDPGRSDVEVLVQMTGSVTSGGGTATVAFELIMADDAALTVNVTSLRGSGAIPQATLVQGYKPRIGGDLPPGISQRYIGFRYTVAGETITGGTITAGIVATLNTRQV